MDHFVPCPLLSVVVVVCCCHCLLWKRVNIWLYLPHALMDFNQSWLVDATWEPSFVDEVKGHLRSSCKIGWKCENGLIWKVEVRFEPNLVYWYNMETFICSCDQMSQIKVKGHLRSTCKIGWKCENGLIWNVEVRFEPNLVYWYNMETFICSCDQLSQIKVKGHLRSTCKITGKCKFGLICILEDQLELP